MTRRFPQKNSLPAALALGAVFAVPSLATAQQTDPNQTNMATGSGAGTSPGQFGATPSSLRVTPYRDMNLGGQLPPLVLPTTPNDPALIDSYEKRLLPLARQIIDPDSRALAMERAARAYIAMPGNRFTEAHTALTEGAQAAASLPQGIIRDLRFRQLSLTFILLAEEQSRESMAQDIIPDGVDKDKFQPRDINARRDRLTKATADWDGAIYCATQVLSGNYRSDLVYRVVDSQAGVNGSQAVINASLGAGKDRTDLAGMGDELYKLADGLLLRAQDQTKYINIVIWRDRGLLSIAVSAAASDQFARGIAIANTIPQPEFRADALIRLGESQARRNLAEDATRTYDQAARAVSSIPLEDPRSILASVLIDSLLSVGRFDDARASVGFYADTGRQVTALGAIAMSQGERDLSGSAFTWIERDAPPANREFLRRKVNDGMLSAIEKQLNRGQSLLGPMGVPPLSRGNQ